VNKFQSEEESRKEILTIDRRAQEEQVTFLKRVRSERNENDVKTALSQLNSAAQGSENLMPFILNAVKSYTSIGEICNTLRKVFGEYRENIAT
jgi:methylmalonyl-CoA mutase N-terminal domain/subunit